MSKYSHLEYKCIVFIRRSSNVRKQAVQLLTFLLQCNPYNSSLPVEEIRQQYEKEKAVLEEMQPKKEEEGLKQAEEKAAQWASIEKELQKYKADNTEEEDKLWENASPGEVHERIRHHLTQLKFSQALSLLSQAKNQFPIFKKLENEDDEQTSMTDQLRAIFFMPLFREMALEADKEAEEENEMSDELKRQSFMVDYLKDSLNFASALNEALPVICTLLGSKQISDVQEAINFFVTAFEFGLLNAMIGVRKMLSLIFSRESNVQAAVVAAYKRLYIESASSSNSSNAVQLVRNLTALVSGATIGDLAGLEELIGMLVKSKDLDKNCFQVMWQMFTKVMPETDDQQSRCALTLLGMVGNIEPNILTTNINVLVEHGFKSDLKMAHDTCLALTKISSSNRGSSFSSDTPPFRLDSDHELFEKLQQLLVESVENVKDDHFMPLAQQAITVIYALSDIPDQMAAEICKQLAYKVAAKPKNSVLLRRAFFVVGHVAVCQVKSSSLD